MNRNQFLAIAVVGILVIAGVVAVVMINGGSEDKKKPASEDGYPRTLKDAYGQEFTLTKEPQTFAAEVRGLNIVSYLGKDIVDRCILATSGVSNGSQPRNGNITNLAYDMPSKCATIKSNNMVDMPQEVLVAKPDIVIIGIGSISDTAKSFKSTMEAAGIPVCFTTTNSSSFTEVHEYLEMNLTVVAKIFNMEERANKIIEQTDKWIEDLQKRLDGIVESDKKHVYYAGGTGKGTGFLATGSNTYYYPAIYIKEYVVNVFEGISDNEYGVVDFQRLYDYEKETHKIDYIFIDEARAWNDFKSLYQADPSKFNVMSAFQNDSVYLVMPYQSNGMITDNCIILAYLYSSLLYPERFTDFDINSFALKVWSFFADSDELGLKVYQARTGYMTNDAGYPIGFFGKIDTTKF